MAGRARDAPTEADLASDDEYYSDDAGMDGNFDDAMALNAKLKAMLAAGIDDPAAAAEILAMAQAASAHDDAAMMAASGHPQRYTEPPPARGRRLGPVRRTRGAPRAARGTARRSRAAPKARAAAPKPGASRRRGNLTFTEDKLNQIGRSNLRLMQNLTSINMGKGVMRTRERKVAIRSSAAINRQRRSRAIQNDNAAFLKRLQNIKPSKALSRTTMKKDADKQKKLAQKCRTVGVRRKKKRLPSLDDRANGPAMNF